MNRVSISDKGIFRPEAEEIFFAEVPITRVDRKVKTLISKDNDPCKNCVFDTGEELNTLCWGISCLNGDEQYTFRRVSNGKN